MGAHATEGAPSDSLSEVPDNMIHMCIMCEGGTLDDVLFDIDARISRNGWAGQFVAGSRDRPSWAYTLGLDD